MATRATLTARAHAALFLTFLGLAATIVLAGPRLAASGLTQAVFFFALVPVALVSAAFLSLALKAAEAQWEGQLWFGRVRLGGPVAVFALVLAAGLFLVKWPQPVSLVVRLHGPEGPGEIVRGPGRVVLDLGKDRREKEISDGEAVFNEIPAELRGQPVRVSVRDLKGYRVKEQSARTVPPDGVVLVELARLEEVSTVTGTVLRADGQPLADALVDFDHGLASVVTNALGEFRISLPRPAGAIVTVKVAFHGRVGFQDNLTVPGSFTVRFKP